MSARAGNRHGLTKWYSVRDADEILDHPHIVLAALVEEHGRDEVLRLLGGEHSTEVPECVEWPTDLSECAYYRRHEPGGDPTGTCSFDCYDEPKCQTCEPTEGWPRRRGEAPEPWRWVIDMPPGLDIEQVWSFPAAAPEPPCSTCGGSGTVPGHNPHDSWDPCPDCTKETTDGE